MSTDLSNMNFGQSRCAVVEAEKFHGARQDPATVEQLAQLKDHIDVLREKPSSKRVVAQLEYWEKHKDNMTKSDAAEILSRLKDEA